MWSSIGGMNGGEFAGSVVALYFGSVKPADFAEFSCWTPHRYTLSIERNGVPLNLALAFQGDLVDEVRADVAESLAERFFDQDYVRVAHGPDEGALLEVPRSRGDLTEVEAALIRLAARTPLVRAMADPTLIGADLSARLRMAAEEIDGDREVRKLLTHCRKTVDWAMPVPSPDMALRMWFVSVHQSWKAAKRDGRQSPFSDARRMAQAVLEDGRFWASGDWGRSLTEIVGMTVASLTRGRTAE